MSLINLFNNWNVKKQKISNNNFEINFWEREIWLCNFWQNIWVEASGKNIDFVRPWIILKKINKYSFYILPLTSIDKKWEYWFIKISDFQEWKNSFANLMQIRVFDKKRLNKRLWKVSIKEFVEIQKKVQNFLFCT